MPLAGTGCAIAPDVLAMIAQARGGDPFDASSLTEDYELYRVQDNRCYVDKIVIPAWRPGSVEQREPGRGPLHIITSSDALRYHPDTGKKVWRLLGARCG